MILPDKRVSFEDKVKMRVLLALVRKKFKVK